ncbi:MAG: PIN domain-containing protein [Nitrospirota bacterium]
MNFLLDTNAVIHLSRKEAEHHENIKAKMLSKALQVEVRICISIVSLYELEYGVAHTDNEQIISESRRIIEFIKKDKEITIFSLTEVGAKIFGEIKEQYRKEKGIGKKALQKHNIDLIIAATAIEAAATLVSQDNKDKIFEILKSVRDDFKWEDWTQ